MNNLEASRMQKVMNFLKGTLKIAKDHKKKTILLVIIISMYSLWKMKHRIPYQKIMQKVMSKVMQAMDKQMKHQQFVDNCNQKLTYCLKEFEKIQHLQNIQTKYAKLFKLESYRNEIRTNVKQMSVERKTELWQNIVDEVILFVFFFLVIQRQTVTLNMLQKTLLAKYNENFISVIGLNKESSANFHLLEQILNEYCQTLIDNSITDTFKFIQNNLKHNIQPTSQMNFFELSKQITDIFKSTLFSKIDQKQEIKHSSSHLTNSIDRPIEKIFFAPHDPTYEKPSIITRSVGFFKGIGQFILPNAFPEEQPLLPTKNRYQILNVLFNTRQQENVAEMNSNKIISNVFKQFIKDNQDLVGSHSNQKPEDDEEFEQTIELSKSSKQNQKVIDLTASNNSKVEINSTKIEQAKVLSSLIIKELRDILEMSSLHNFFYYSCLFELRKFLNRLLLVLQKKNELNNAQSFALFSKFFDKLVVEEFLKSDAEQNNEGFYQVRLKKCFNLTKNLKTNGSQQNNDNNLNSTDDMSNANKSEQDLISSGENQILQISSDSIQTDPIESLINLNILQEIEQFYIVEDSLQELIKRVFFEREKSTIQIENAPKANNNADASQQDMNGGDLSGLMSLLSGSQGGGQADFMSLLSNI